MDHVVKGKSIFYFTYGKVVDEGNVVQVLKRRPDGSTPGASEVQATGKVNVAQKPIRVQNVWLSSRCC